MFLKIQHGQERVRIRFIAVHLDRRPQERLRQDHICECGEVEHLRVVVEQLSQEVLNAMEVYCGLRIKPFEVNIEHFQILRSNRSACARDHNAPHRGGLRTLSLLLSSSAGGLVPPISTSPSFSSLRFPILLSLVISEDKLRVFAWSRPSEKAGVRKVAPPGLVRARPR